MSGTATSNRPISAGTPLLDHGIRAVNFFNGRLVTSADMRRDQDARREGDARLGEAIGAGVVRGLEVYVEGLGTRRELKILRGLAVNGAGQTLCLGSDQVLALVPEPEEGAATATGGFGACKQLAGGSYVAGDGLYLLTLAPATLADGTAQVLALEPGNLRCNSDVVVEAVQFRLLRVRDAVLESHGLDLDAADTKSLFRLRSAAAAACLRRTALGAAHAKAASTVAKGLLEEMADYGLSACDVPLALVYLDAVRGVGFVDRWAVRRPVAAGAAADAWSAWTGEPLARTAQAQWLQFQEQLEEIQASELATLKAAEWFAWLPPAGFLDASGARAVAWAGFLGTLAPARTVTLAPGDAPAVLAQALCRDGVALTAPARSFRVYTIAGGPSLFVRDAPNVRHAEEVWVDTVRAGLPAAARNVQAALEHLHARCCAQVVLRPGTHDAATARKLLEQAAKDSPDVIVCVEAGTLELDQPLLIEGLRSLALHGHGATSMLRCRSGATALMVVGCRSLAISGLALRADQPAAGKDIAGEFPGVLTVVDTDEVHVDGLTVHCGNGETLQASAVTVVHRSDWDEDRDEPRRLRLERCDLQVGSGQQGLACSGMQMVRAQGNTVWNLDVARPMARGIVVGGSHLVDVRVEDNTVQWALRGIELGFTQTAGNLTLTDLPPDREGGTSGRKSHAGILHAVVARNWIGMGLPFELAKFALGGGLGGASASELRKLVEKLSSGGAGLGMGGVVVGMTRWLQVESNTIGQDEPIEGLQLSGVLLAGDMGTRLLLSRNHLVGLPLPIDLRDVKSPPTEGNALWLLEGNLAEDVEQLVHGPDAVVNLLRWRDNVPDDRK